MWAACKNVSVLSKNLVQINSIDFSRGNSFIKGLQVNRGGCSAASLLRVWYFAILIMFWNIPISM